MKSLDCNEEMRLGFIKVQDSLLNTTNQVIWYPIEEKDKKWYKSHKEYVSLDLVSEKAYYCETCMQAVAVFKQR